MRGLLQEYGFGLQGAAQATKPIYFGRPIHSPRSKGISFGRRSAAWLDALSTSPLPARAISLICNEVVCLSRKIVPRREFRKEGLDEEIQLVKRVVDRPNYRDRIYENLLPRTIEDYLKFGMGAWEYVDRPRGMGGSPVGIFAVAGSQIVPNTSWDGQPNLPRWVWFDHEGNSKPLLDRQVEVFQDRLRTTDVFPVGKLEVAAGLMDAWLGLDTYQAEVASTAYPSHLVSLGKEAEEKDVIAYREYWENDLRGTGRPGVVGGFDVTAVATKGLNDEALFLQYQERQIRIFAFVFDLQAQDFNLQADVNRNQGEIQDKKTRSEAVKPIALKIQAAYNNTVIPRIAQVTGNNRIEMLALKFPELDYQDPVEMSEVHERYRGADILSRDEIREQIGYEPEGDAEAPAEAGEAPKAENQRLLRVVPQQAGRPE